MHPRLPSRLSDVDANVVTVRRVLLLHKRFSLAHQQEHGVLFFDGHIEKACHMAPGNDEHMAAT